MKRPRAVPRAADLAASMLLALLLPGGSAGATEMLRAVDEPREVIHEELRVTDDSGSRIVAVMTGRQAEVADLGGLSVLLPEHGAERLCLRLGSIDGAYEAAAEYEVAGRPPGGYALAFASRHRRALEEYAKGQLVASGRLAESCDAEDRGRTVPMSWGAPERDSLLVFVNSNGHEARIQLPAAAAPGGYQTAICDDLPESRPRRSYDKLCVVTVRPRAEMEKGWFELIHFGERVHWEPLEISLPE